MFTKLRKLPFIVASGTGAYGIYSSHRLYCSLITPIDKLRDPPADSLLEKRCYETSDEHRVQSPYWNDCYRISRTISVPIDQSELDIDGIELSNTVAKAFFMSSASAMERYLGSKAGVWKHTEQELLNGAFHIDELFGVFRVDAKTEDQIMFEWKVGSERVIGVTFLSAAIVPGMDSQNEDKNMDITLHFGTAFVKPRHLPMMIKVLLPFHGFYTRILLSSTMDKFVELAFPSNSNNAPK